jgi:hypothetical protein
MDNKLYLTQEEFEKIKRKEVGHGTDGIVYAYQKNYVIKVYRNNFHCGVRYIASPDNDFEKLSTEEAMEKVTEKQLRVVKTHLPKKLVYVDGEFVGVLLQKVRGIQVHKLTGAPFAYRKKVALAIIEAVKELLDNNIYHEDLSNSPYTLGAYTDETHPKSKGHSHVLLNPFTMKINIIDLEGKSTVYADYLDKEHEGISLSNLSELLFEFLYQVDKEEYDIDNDLDENYSIVQELKNHGIDDEQAREIAKAGFRSIEEAQDVVSRSR